MARTGTHDNLANARRTKHPSGGFRSASLTYIVISPCGTQTLPSADSYTANEGQRMVNSELRRAAAQLELGLRRLPFREGETVVSERRVHLKHPIDLDGNKDESYIVVSFSHDLPPFWLHREVSSVETYVAVLILQKISATVVLDWAKYLFKVGRNSEMPWPLRVLRLTLRLMSPILWASAIIVHLREAKRLSRLGERFGVTNLCRPDCRVVWLHAASLGEVKRLHKIILKLQGEPNVKVVVTTFTASSAAWLDDTFSNVIHQYAPIDTAGCLSRFLDHWKPDTLIVSENELWPEMIIKSAEAGLLMIQVEARPSRTRKRYPNSVGFLLNHFATITCTAQKVYDDLIYCGVDRSRVVFCQNARKATPNLRVDEDARKTLLAQIGPRKVWVAASTHSSDLRIVLDAHVSLQTTATPVLIIAPRHPREAHEIRTACLRRGLNVAQRSKKEPLMKDIDVYIADTFGELGTLFSITKIVYLGGGHGVEGGHNPYEPSAFGCRILSGPRVENFEDAFRTFCDAKIAEFVNTAGQLAYAIDQIWALRNPEIFASNKNSNFEPDLGPTEEIIYAKIQIMDDSKSLGEGLIN